MRNAVESVVASMAIHAKMGLLATVASTIAATKRLSRTKYCFTLVNPTICFADSSRKYRTEYIVVAKHKKPMIRRMIAPNASTVKKMEEV